MRRILPLALLPALISCLGPAGVETRVAQTLAEDVVDDPEQPGPPARAPGEALQELPFEECPRVLIEAPSDTKVNIREAPSRADAILGALSAGQIVEVVDLVEGESVDGITEWFEIAFADGSHTGFVSATLTSCTFDDAVRAPPNGYLLPLACGAKVRVSQGNNSGFSHTGRTQYAFDFALARGTPLLAIADGTVLDVFDETGPGDDCFNGGGSSCFLFANYVLLRHDDGNTSIYKHLDAVHVTEGERVTRGTTVGLSGSTGWSTGPHAHVMRQVVCDGPNCQSMPLDFTDVPGNGVPVSDQYVISQNCQ